MANKLERKVQLFNEIVQEMAALYKDKNKNYGDSFGKLVRDLGLIAGLTPLHNKLDRITNLIKGEESKFESLEDNLIDLANYSIMNLIELRLKLEEMNTNEETKDNNDNSKDKTDSSGNNDEEGISIVGDTYDDKILKQEGNTWKLKDNYQPWQYGDEWWLPQPCRECIYKYERPNDKWTWTSTTSINIGNHCSTCVHGPINITPVVYNINNTGGNN